MISYKWTKKKKRSNKLVETTKICLDNRHNYQEKHSIERYTSIQQVIFGVTAVLERTRISEKFSERNIESEMVIMMKVVHYGIVNASVKFQQYFLLISKVINFNFLSVHLFNRYISIFEFSEQRFL